LLPFTELAPLRSLGSDGNPQLITPSQRQLGKQRVSTFVSSFLCPSRRVQTQFPYPNIKVFFNIDRPDLVARNDYAACAGSQYMHDPPRPSHPWEGPAPAAGGGMPDPLRGTGYGAFNVGQPVATIPQGNGVVLVMSETRVAQITDGTSSTLLLGEKHMPVGDYEVSEGAANNQGWDIGFDWDINRWTKWPPYPDSNANLRDGAILGEIGDNPFDEFIVFGGPHPAGCQFVFCDGSVKAIAYDADVEVFRALGSIAGGEAVDHSSL
jgi:prepilin-type processing-associated H-X9-DG protein